MGRYKIGERYKALLSDGIHTFQVLEFGSGNYVNFIAILWDDGTEEWGYPGDMDRWIDAAREKENLEIEGSIISDPPMYCPHLTMHDSEFINIKLSKSGVINPIDITTESKGTIEERILELLNLLESLPNYSVGDAMQALSDFLSSDPELSERVIPQIREYVNQKK